jgi:hypothetical protein
MPKTMEKDTKLGWKILGAKSPAIVKSETKESELLWGPNKGASEAVWLRVNPNSEPVESAKGG